MPKSWRHQRVGIEPITALMRLAFAHNHAHTFILELNCPERLHKLFENAMLSWEIWTPNRATRRNAQFEVPREFPRNYQLQTHLDSAVGQKLVSFNYTKHGDRRLA